MKLYTEQQLRKKYAGKFIDVYPHHLEKRCPKTNKWVTVYEVRGVSKFVKENFQSLDEVFV